MTNPIKLGALTLLFVFVAVGSSYGAVFTVTNTNDSGAGSLVQAVADANGNPGSDTIEFAIPGAGPHTIDLDTVASLPLQLNGPVIVDGYSQPGSAPNTNGAPQPFNGTPMIQISGSWTHALHTNGDGVVIKGLIITGNLGAGIRLVGSGNHRVEGCMIGLVGQSAVANSIGIFVTSSQNTVGGTTPAARNVISGNNNQNISIKFSATTQPSRATS